MIFTSSTLALTALFVLAIAWTAIRWMGRKSSGSFEIRNPLVIDGDTIFANGCKIRLHGIDAPEMDQAGGVAAKEALARLLYKKTITVQKTDTDRYGRIVARLTTKDGDIGRLMVSSGYAIASFHDDYRSHESRARSAKKGLWANGGIADPSLHRRSRA